MKIGLRYDMWAPDLHFSTLCITMHHPLRLAEDLTVLDFVSGHSRVLVTAGIRYRPHEFAMFGVDYADRATVFEYNLAALRKAWTGDEFEFEGRRSFRPA